MSRRVPALDGVRALGTVWLVIVGILGVSLTGEQLGTLWVPITGSLVLSAYLTYRPLAHARHVTQRPRPRQASRLVRRGVRLLPPYWLSLLAWFAVTGDASRDGPVPLLTLATLTSVFDADARALGPPLAWVLSATAVGVVGLVAWSALSGWLDRVLLADASTRLGLELCGIAALAFASFAWPLLRPATIGMALAVGEAVLRRDGAPGGRVGRVLGSPRVWVAVALGGLAVLPFLRYEGMDPVRQTVRHPLLFGAASLASTAVLVLVVMVPICGRAAPRAFKVLGNRWARLGASMAYGGYLWHGVVSRVVADQVGPDAQAPLLFVGLIGTLVLAFGQASLVDPALARQAAAMVSAKGAARGR